LGGNAPILLRATSTAAGASGQQTSALRITLRVVPDSPAITIQPMLDTCTTGFQLTADQTFVPGVQLRTSLHPRSATFLVAGLSTWFLPVAGLANCFVVPSPDVVAAATGAPIVIPAGAAPLQFYVQSVAIERLSPSLSAAHASNSLLVRMQ
jgi:hypothetical protein